MAEADETPGPPGGDDDVQIEEAFDEGDGSAGLLQGAARAAVLLTGAGLIGQVFTMVRELFVAAKVGVSPDLDALLIAAVVPMMMAGFLASGTGAAIVPSYLSISKERGRPTADRLLGATLTWTVIVGVVLSALVAGAAGLAVTIAGPGLNEQARAVAIGYVPIVAPMALFAALGGLLGSVFQIHDRMRSIAVAWIVGPIVSVVVTIGLWGNLGLTALAIAMTIQQVAIVVVLVAMGLRLRILPPVSLRADRAESSRFVRHALPLTISASVLNFNLLTDRAIATLIAPGAVSALRYAEGVIRIPMSAIGPAWSAAIYPTLVRASLIVGGRTFTQATADSLRYVTAIFVPLSVATAAMAPVIVEVAYVRGAFDERAAVLTAGALAGFAPLLVLTMAQSVLVGAHNARKRGVFLMTMGFLNVILNAVFNIGFGILIGVAGIALSTSLTVGIIQVINAWRLGTLEDRFPLGELAVVTGRSLAASLVVAVPIAAISWSMPYGLGLLHSLAILFALATAGMVGYVGLAHLIGLDEPWIVVRALLRAPRRLGPGAG